MVSRVLKCVDQQTYEPDCHPNVNDIPFQNTMGVCECEGQIFASSDCRSAYHCRDDLSTGGCLAECDPGEIIIPDPRSVISVIIRRRI